MKILSLNLGGGGSSSNSFSIIQPITGTSPTATSATDTLTFVSGDATVSIIGNSATKTLDFRAAAAGVTSVGLTMPAIFSVAGSPVTGSDTLAVTLATQAANKVWSGPTNGAAATPTFRSLVGADLPNPSSSTLGGVQSYAAVSNQWIRSISTSGVPASSQPAFTDISGTAAVTQGGTGVTSATAYAVLTGGTTSTGAFQSIASVGTSGQLLISNGAGALPTFQTAPELSADLTFTHAQVLALNTTPLQIVAAPGAGFALVVTQMYATATFFTTAYTAAGSLTVIHGADTNTLSTVGTGIINAAATAQKSGGPGSNPVVKENSALRVFCSTGNPTEAGTADTVIRCRVYYRVVPVPLP